MVRERAPARHEVPDIDEAALAAARAADRVLASARDVSDRGIPAGDRWARHLARLPERLRDDPLPGLRAAARQARSAYGPKDSIRDVLPADVTEPFLDALDRLIKVIARHDAER